MAQNYVAVVEGTILESLTAPPKRFRVATSDVGKYYDSSKYRSVTGVATAERDRLPAIEETELLATIPTEASTDKGVIPETVTRSSNKPEIVDDVSTLLLNPRKNVVLNIGSVKTVPKVVNQPGLISREIAIRIGEALKEHCKQVMGSDSSTDLATYFIHLIQLAITFSTSKNSEYKEFDYIETETQKKIYIKDVSEVVERAAMNSGYENPFRQYMRYFTSSSITLTLNGKITPNERTMAHHGVPKQFFAYTYDFIDPDYSLMNHSAINAYNLARIQAFKNKIASVNNTMHNTYQLNQGAVSG
uniref:Coat protein n=1 Tax=Pineapple mealybug wilt-associated virus 2 TaxID=136234 RepID=B3VLC0_9CLOS|nr:coat protein [Pineapple mealybug wilt-associated virus 2]